MSGELFTTDASMVPQRTGWEELKFVAGIGSRLCAEHYMNASRLQKAVERAKSLWRHPLEAANDLPRIAPTANMSSWPQAARSLEALAMSIPC